MPPGAPLQRSQCQVISGRLLCSLQFESPRVPVEGLLPFPRHREEHRGSESLSDSPQVTQRALIWGGGVGWGIPKVLSWRLGSRSHKVTCSGPELEPPPPHTHPGVVPRGLHTFREGSASHTPPGAACLPRSSSISSVGSAPRPTLSCQAGVPTAPWASQPGPSAHPAATSGWGRRSRCLPRTAPHFPSPQEPSFRS